MRQVPYQIIGSKESMGVPDFVVHDEPQLELFPNLPGRGATIDERFADFHKKNPHVYRNLVCLAFDDMARGIHRGVAALFEEIRYAFEGTDHDPSEYKLNNDYASRYARLIMRSEPRLVGHFETRTLKAL
jgi:hypothetical protein